MLLKVEVTQAHIDKGGGTQPCFHCPIALAVKDAGIRDAAVHSQYIKYAFNGRVHFIHLPEKAMFFIQHFDKGWPVQPFTFEVDAYEA